MKKKKQINQHIKGKRNRAGEKKQHNETNITKENENKPNGKRE